MAARFARAFRGKFINTPGRGWLEFNSSYWVECGDARPWQAVHSVCLDALAELPKIQRTDWRDALYDDIRKCDSDTGTAGVLRHARNWPGIAIRDEELDAHPELFVVQNGTIELDTFQFRRSDPADLMTLAAGVAYDADAQCPLYDELLALYQPDPGIRDYLHRLGGAAMEGRQNLQQLIVHYGASGGNGKGTTQRAWQHVFGAYAHVLPVEALIARRGYDQYRDEKAQLKGKRLVYVTEPSAGQRFDTGTVKSITGGDPVTSRAVYKASVTFLPTWLIMMATNNRVSTPADGGMARRLKEIGWTFKVQPGTERDDLDERLRAEGSGILNRLLAGWHSYRKSGVGEPESVKIATAEYLASVDPVQLFVDECVIEKPGHKVASGSLYKAYDDWCRENNEHPLPGKLFSPDMERRGYVKARHGGGMMWVGIALVATNRAF
jgi:putative DNA primase/helicase